MPRHANSTSFRPGYTRSSESIQKQRSVWAEKIAGGWISPNIGRKCSRGDVERRARSRRVKALVECVCRTCHKTFHLLRGQVESGRGLFCGMPCFRKKPKSWDVMKVLDLWNAGKSTRAISKELGIVEMVLKRWLTSQGVYEPRHVSGKQHYAWKGGLSDQNSTERHRAMRLAKYQNWRRLVFDRDGFHCQKCPQLGGDLQAHHIKPWAKFVNLRYDISNGLTLCKKCHGAIHRGCRDKD